MPFFSYKIVNFKYLACHFKPPTHKIPLVCVTCPCLSVWQLYQLYNMAFAKLSKYTRVYQTSFKVIRPHSGWIILQGICRLGLHVYTGVDPGIFEKGGGGKLWFRKHRNPNSQFYSCVLGPKLYLHVHDPNESMYRYGNCNKYSRCCTVQCIYTAFIPTTFWDESNYEVAVLINEIMKLLWSHTLSYSFLSAPSRITSSPDRQTVTEGSNLDVYCNATGKPAPNITWTRVLENGTNSKVLFVGSPWRTVNIRRNFTGQYRCTAYNGIGDPVNHTFPVNVLCEYTLYF